MTRTLWTPLGVVVAVGLIAAAPIARAGTPSTEQAARVAAIKQIQVRQLMGEALDADREHGEADADSHEAMLERAREMIARRREEKGGVRQIPDPESPASRAAAAARGRSAGPLTSKTGTLSYATNVLCSDPNLDVPSRADGQSEPSIAAWGSFVLVGWNDGRGINTIPNSSLPGLMAYGYSVNGGQSFVDGGTPPSPLLGGTWTSDPVIAVNEKTGDFYYCGLMDPDDASGNDYHGVCVVRGNFVGSNFVWSTPTVIKSVLDPELIDKCWLAADSVSGNIYLTYTRFTTVTDSIVVVRSTDKGLHWGPQITLSSNAAAGRVQGSRPCVGPDGEVYVVWKEIGTSASGQDFMRIRRSNDFGQTWGSEQTAATFFDNFGTGAPSFNREQGITLPGIAVDRSSGANRGRVYVTWNECVNFYDSIPDSNFAPVVHEAEPNDTTLNATPFTPGNALRGAFDTLTDFDYYKFNAAQGTTYIFWANELPTRYTMRIFGTDGVTRLSFSGDRFNSPPNQGFIVWTCPVTGTYYFRMAIFGSTLGDYRVDTGIDNPGGAGQRARDQRDVFVASSTNGTSWTTPSLVNGAEPAWFDNWLPEVAVTGQGTVYALWYDWSDSPEASSGGQSQTYMARSDDAGVTWASLGPVSDRFVNWTFVNSNIIPNEGDYLGLFANATGVYPCWTDGRVGTPDIWTAPFSVTAVQVAIVSVAADTDNVTIAWRASGPYPASAQVMRATGTGAYQNIGTVTFDAGGVATFDDVNVLTAQQYRYALQLVINASQQVMGEHTVITPGRVRPALAFLGADNNPIRGTLRISFTLPDNEPAEVRLFDVGGRPLALRRYQGAGTYAGVDLSQGLNLKAGLYFLRLTHGGQDVMHRVSFLP